MKAILLVAALTATPVLADMPRELSESNRYYLLTELNRSAMEEVIQPADEVVKRTPVRTFLSNRIAKLKWRPLGKIITKIKNKD
jgi:hypothetical protein